MTEWHIKPRNQLRGKNSTLLRSQAPKPHLALLEPTRGRSAGVRPQQPVVGPAVWQLLTALFEIVMFVLHYYMIGETLESAGVEINKFFKDDVLLGWIFESAPQLTARELLALVTAAFFVGLPIAVWLNLLDETPRKSSLGSMIVRAFLLIAYAFIIVGEALLVLHRVSLGNNNAFMVQSGHEPAIAIFFSLLFVIVNATAAYTTASLYGSRKSNGRA